MLQTTSGETLRKSNFFKIKSRSEIEESLRNLRYILENILGQNCANNITNTSTSDPIQNLIYSRNSTDGCLKLLVDTIIYAGITSEKRSSGSSKVFLSTIFYFLRKFENYSSRKDFISSAREEIIDFSKRAGESARPVSKLDLDLLINSYFNFLHNSSIPQIISDIFEKESPNTEIIVEKGLLEKTAGTRSEGHFLKIEIPQISVSKEGSWIRNDPDVILVDGFIESVSQIHHLLSIYSQSFKPILIVCRKAGEEVKETIIHNFLRGTLDAVLVEVDFDLNYINIFEDLRAIYNCNVVDINMGDTLSSSLEKNIFKIPSIKIKGKGIIFGKMPRNENLESYIRDLQDLKDSSNIQKEGLDQVLGLISNRIRFLNSSTYDIKIGKSEIKSNPNIVENIDEFFRSISEMSSFGVISSEDILTAGNLGNFLASNLSRPIFLQKSIAIGLISAFQTLKLFTNAEKMLILDR